MRLFFAVLAALCFAPSAAMADPTYHTFAIDCEYNMGVMDHARLDELVFDGHYLLLGNPMITGAVVWQMPGTLRDSTWRLTFKDFVGHTKTIDFDSSVVHTVVVTH